jgi:hypothetical protein
VSTARGAGQLVRWGLLLTSAATYWLLFMCVHEFGHVLAACCTGGHVSRVVLSPLALSRTDVMPNPCPLVEVWGGPAFGAGAPLLFWSVWRAARLPGAAWLQGFAGFSLIANGLYIASGVYFPAGDTEELIRLGTSRCLLLAGVPAAILGLWGIHRLGPGLGTKGLSDAVARRATMFTGLALCATVMVILAIGDRPEPMSTGAPPQSVSPAR